MIRKSAFIIILIVAILTGVIIFVLGDSFVENMAEFALSKGLKTEVDIEGLDIDPLNFKVSFNSLKVMDPNNPSNSMAASGPADFDVKGMQLLAKKLVIDNMSLKDLVIDSAFSLPKEPESKDEEKEGESITDSVKKLADNLPELDLDVLAKDLDIEEYVHPEKLKSLQAIKQAEKDANEKIAYWQNTINNNTIEADLRQLQNDFNQLRKANPKTLPEYQIALNELQSLREKAIKTEKQTIEIYQTANQDMKAVGTGFGNIKTLTEDDIKGTEKLANLKEINASHIGKMLFGREMVTRFDTAKGYLDQVRGFFGEAEKKPERKVGRNIHFPVTSTVYPQFLIQLAQINGQLLREGKPTINWNGTIHDFTTEQDLTGKPATFDVSGDTEGKPTRYHLQGIFDNRNKNKIYRINLKGSELILQQVELRKNDQTWPSYMSSKDAELTVNLIQQKDTMEGTIVLLAKSVQFSFAKSKGNKLGETDRAVRETFEDLKNVEVRSTLKGTLTDPQFSVSSNVDDILAKRLDDMVGRKIKEARDAIRNRIESQVNGARNAAEANINKQKQVILARVDSYKQEIDKQKQQIENQKKEIERKQDEQIEAQKREAENKLRQEMDKKTKETQKKLEQDLKNKLKSLFK